jgi:hypothetical protein
MRRRLLTRAAVSYGRVRCISVRGSPLQRTEERATPPRRRRAGRTRPVNGSLLSFRSVARNPGARVAPETLLCHPPAQIPRAACPSMRRPTFVKSTWRLDPRRKAPAGWWCSSARARVVISGVDRRRRIESLASIRTLIEHTWPGCTLGSVVLTGGCCNLSDDLHRSEIEGRRAVTRNRASVLLLEIDSHCRGSIRPSSEGRKVPLSTVGAGCWSGSDGHPEGRSEAKETTRQRRLDDRYRGSKFLHAATSVWRSLEL